MPHKRSRLKTPASLWISALLLSSIVSCQSPSTSAILATKEPSTAQVTANAPDLPRPFQSKSLQFLDTPRVYFKDSCQYIKDKWNSNNAAPGTVVLPIMFGEINRGVATDKPEDITAVELQSIMEHLKNQGFEAINMQQFLGFMLENKKIPPRSVLLILDGRWPRSVYDDLLRDYRELWGWTVINAWPSQPDISEEMWLDQIALENEGFVDHQAQGMMIGSKLSDESPKAVITRELQGSITTFEERFNKKPIAIIWQGGGFGARPVEMARELGYQLGFTINARGPIMFNWVPLANKFDKDRPAYSPEGAINDPLMTLPRYWAPQVIDSLDTVRFMGKEAAAYAEKNKPIEMEYYAMVCAPTYGPIP